MSKINYKRLITNILIPLIIGGIGALLAGGFDTFTSINKPPFTPPSILFPIVWTILYILMGISSYIINKNYSIENKETNYIYAINLFINAIWPLLFFRFKWYLFSFFWILLLIITTILLIIKYYKINKNASYIQIPYLIWLLFASILNISIYILNR